MVRRRVVSVNRCYFGLRKQIGGRLLSRETKLHLYKTIIRPVLMYGSETWTTTKACEQDLLVFERKILRRIFGGVLVDGTWRRRKNQEVYDAFGENNIVQVIKLGRLRWAGHIARMNEEEMPRKLLTEHLYRTRRRGRPRLRWSDGVTADARTILGVRNWMAAAQNRDDWRKLLVEAKTRHRVVAPN